MEGCANVEYRRGICRSHWHLIPFSERIRWATEQMDAMHALKRQHDQEAASIISQVA